MLGLKRHTVKLVPRDDSWSIIFEETKKELLNLIGHLIKDIQHVGSTSIQNIYAKPIIDIAIAVESMELINKMKIILERNGYEYRGDGGKEGGHLFVKCNAPDIRTHHIHIVHENNYQWKNFLKFRNILIGNPELASEYSEFKKGLERKYFNDRKEYTKAKNDFINKVLMNKEKITPN